VEQPRVPSWVYRIHGRKSCALYLSFESGGIEPNVKDEPRPSLARLVQQYVERSVLFLR
jgi:hypothetical protein